MPFKSEAQRRYFYANKEKLEAQGVDVDEWARETKGRKLPERVGKKKAKKTPAAEKVARSLYSPSWLRD